MSDSRLGRLGASVNPGIGPRPTNAPHRRGLLRRLAVFANLSAPAYALWELAPRVSRSACARTNACGQSHLKQHADDDELVGEHEDRVLPKSRNRTRTTRVSLAVHGDSAGRARERSFSFPQTLPSYPPDRRTVSRPARISFASGPLSAFQVRDGSSQESRRAEGAAARAPRR